MECKTCRFYVQGQQGGMFTTASGYCYRYPPAALLDKEIGFFTGLNTRPLVTADDWCGEHQKIEDSTTSK